MTEMKRELWALTGREGGEVELANRLRRKKDCYLVFEAIKALLLTVIIGTQSRRTRGSS